MGFGDFLSKGLTTAGKVMDKTQTVMNKVGATVGLPPVPSVGGALAKKASELVSGKQVAKVSTSPANVTAAVQSTTSGTTNVRPAPGSNPPPGPVKAFVLKYWWILLPLVLIIAYFLLKGKKKYIRRRSVKTFVPRSRGKRRSSPTRLSGSAFVKRMRLAKLRKARSKR